MQSSDISIRLATVKDMEIVYWLLTQKAEFDGFFHTLPATREQLQQTLFCMSPSAHVLLAEVQQTMAGFLLFFQTYSSFLAKPSLWIDDLFVQAPLRHRGIGTALIQHLMQIAQVQQCGRIEWIVNSKNAPALHFYKKQGAQILENIQVCRLVLPLTAPPMGWPTFQKDS